jgi:hypothetical protein
VEIPLDDTTTADITDQVAEYFGLGVELDGEGAKVVAAKYSVED